MPESRTIQDSEESSDELSSAEDSKSPSPKQTTATSKKRPASPEPALTSTAQQDEDPGAIEKKPIAGLADVANTVAPTEDSPGPSTAVAAEAAAELPPPLSKEEEAKARKVAAMLARNKALEAQIEALEGKLAAERALLKDPDAAATVRAHIRLLHEYNEIRDIGQGLIGMIADNRGVRITECYESGEFGVGVKD